MEERRPSRPGPEAMPDRRRGDYLLTTDRARFDVAAIHAYLERSYWSPGIPYEVVAQAVDHSLGFALLHQGEQIGFARVITDYATFAYLADVYVLETHRGRSLGKWLVEGMLEHPGLQGLRRFLLVTADAHGLYERFGFSSLTSPERMMERSDPDVYRSSSMTFDTSR